MTAEKISGVIACVLGITLTMAAVWLLVSIAESKKDHKKHNERLKGIDEELLHLYCQLNEGIKSGRLKVAVVNKDRILFAKESKPKKKGKK